MIEKIYANQAACHIREKNWQRAVETADKVNHSLFCATRTTLIRKLLTDRLSKRTRTTTKRCIVKDRLLANKVSLREPRRFLKSSNRRVLPVRSILELSSNAVLNMPFLRRCCCDR